MIHQIESEQFSNSEANQLNKVTPTEKFTKENNIKNQLDTTADGINFELQEINLIPNNASFMLNTSAMSLNNFLEPSYIPTSTEEEYSEFFEENEEYEQEKLRNLYVQIEKVNLESGSSDNIQTFDSIGSISSIKSIIKNNNEISKLLINKLKELKDLCYKWRKIKGDGNCFYRSVIFAYIENIILTNKVSRLRDILVDMARNYQEDELKEKLYLSQVNASHILMCMLIIYGLLKTNPQNNENTINAYSIFIKCFNNVNEFDLGLVLYFRYLIYKFIKKNENKYFTQEFPIKLGNLLPNEYETTDGTFLFTKFYDEFLLKLYKDAEKIVIYSTPYVLDMNFNILMWQLENKTLFHKKFKIKNISHVKEINTITIFYRSQHYDIAYNEKFSKDYKTFLEIYDEKKNDDNFYERRSVNMKLDNDKEEDDKSVAQSEFERGFNSGENKENSLDKGKGEFMVNLNEQIDKSNDFNNNIISNTFPNKKNMMSDDLIDENINERETARNGNFHLTVNSHGETAKKKSGDSSGQRKNDNINEEKINKKKKLISRVKGQFKPIIPIKRRNVKVRNLVIKPKVSSNKLNPEQTTKNVKYIKKKPQINFNDLIDKKKIPTPINNFNKVDETTPTLPGDDQSLLEGLNDENFTTKQEKKETISKCRTCNKDLKKDQKKLALCCNCLLIEIKENIKKLFTTVVSTPYNKNNNTFFSFMRNKEIYIYNKKVEIESVINLYNKYSPQPSNADPITILKHIFNNMCHNCFRELEGMKNTISLPCNCVFCCKQHLWEFLFNKKFQFPFNENTKNIIIFEYNYICPCNKVYSTKEVKELLRILNLNRTNEMNREIVLIRDILKFYDLKKEFCCMICSREIKSINTKVFNCVLIENEMNKFKHLMCEVCKKQKDIDMKSKKLMCGICEEEHYIAGIEKITKINQNCNIF